MRLYIPPTSKAQEGRARLLQKLSAYVPAQEADRETRGRFLSLVENHSQCFSRSFYPAHITGSSWIISSDADAVLLHHHRKLDIWVQLGGHADGCADILAVALREAEEESGISGFEVVSDAIFDLDIHRIPAHRDEPEHFHYDIRFLLRAPQGALPRCSEESKILDG